MRFPFESDLAGLQVGEIFIAVMALVCVAAVLGCDVESSFKVESPDKEESTGSGQAGGRQPEAVPVPNYSQLVDGKDQTYTQLTANEAARIKAIRGTFTDYEIDLGHHCYNSFPSGRHEQFDRIVQVEYAIKVYTESYGSPNPLDLAYLKAGTLEESENGAPLFEQELVEVVTTRKYRYDMLSFQRPKGIDGKHRIEVKVSGRTNNAPPGHEPIKTAPGAKAVGVIHPKTCEAELVSFD